MLIAMYRMHDADDAWRADTRKRIDSLAQAIEKQIEDKSEQRDRRTISGPG